MNITHTTLDNGLDILTIPIEDMPTATIMVMVNAGARMETPDTNGVSHFLEHMCFKGTENRPGPQAVATDLDKLGAESNAFTNHEYTAHYGKAQADKTEDIICILADIYKHSTLPAEEIDREAGVITEEIRMYEDLPMRTVHDLMRKNIFGNQPAGWRILGSQSIVQSLDRDDLATYRQTHYVPATTTIVVAGGINKQHVQEAVTGKFSSLSKEANPNHEPADYNPDRQPVTHLIKDTDQTHLVVGTPAVSSSSDQLPAWQLLAGILGKGMSSRLFAKLRDKMGVCYYVRSSVADYSDTGILKISTGVTLDRLAEVVGAITETLQNIARDGVGTEELEKAKNFVAGNHLMDHETSDEIATGVAVQSTLDLDIETPADHAQKLQSVTATQIKTAAQEALENGLSTAVIGPRCDREAVADKLPDSS
jgi:predicted Zn-dependent peptidase